MSSQPPATPGAVFLSYAREDSEAARRIADALRGSGVEVWFDEAELRGGDAWDQKIRRQIDECALFLPLISPHTQSRSKGYFRLEWKLAVDQMHLRAEGVPYLAPVAIAEIGEAEALVPADFRRVQWMRLPGALPTPEFVAQVQRLLGTPAPAGSHGGAYGGGSRAPAAPGGNSAGAPDKPRTRKRLGIAAGAVLAVAVALIGWRMISSRDATPGASTAAAGQSVVDKSVAVLAFENRSSEKDSEYFSDGISEELLNVLAKVPGLRVAGRASSFQFKGKNEAGAKVGQELKVGHLVQGSVQRIGTRARITAELTVAATGETLWRGKFDTELKDIFGAQDEIAGLIAKQLSLTLGGARRTEQVDPEAHRLLLEGRHLWNLRSGEGLAGAETFFARAAAIAPDFAELHADWALLEVIRANTSSVWRGNVDIAADIERGRMRAHRALALDPASGEATAALAYAMHLEGKLEEADRLFRRALELQPNASAIHSWYAQLLAGRGYLTRSLGEHAKAYELDPLSAPQVGVYIAELIRARRYEDAVRIGEPLRILHPNFVHTRAALGRAYAALGRKQQALDEARFVLQHPDYAPRWQSDIFANAILYQLGATAEATGHAERLLKNFPAGSFMQGFILISVGRFGDAVPMLARVPNLQIRGLFYDEIWDPWRGDPRFAQVIANLGVTAEYERGWSELQAIRARQSSKP